MGRAPTPERANTEIIDLLQAPTAPVFVDPSGGRRRRLRPIMYVIAVLIVLGLALLWVSQFGAAEPPDQPCTSGATGTSGSPAPVDCRR